MKRKLDTCCPYMTTYRMYKDSKRKFQFPLAVTVSYQAGDCGKSGAAFEAMWRANDCTPKQVERLYPKRLAMRPAIVCSAKHEW